MTAPAYTPRQGSTAEVAMQQLRARGPMRSGPLAAVCDTDTTTLMSCLSTALRFGAVKRSGARGDFTWSLGDGKPPIQDDEPDDHPVVQRVVPAAGQPLPVAVLKARATDHAPQEKPAGAELTEALMRAMAGAPVGNPVQEAVAEELAAAFDRSMVAAPSAPPPGAAPAAGVQPPPDGSQSTEEYLRATVAASREVLAELRAALAEREQQVTYLTELLEQLRSAQKPVDIPVTVSITATAHQVERISAFVRSMTEVRP